MATPSITPIAKPQPTYKTKKGGGGIGQMLGTIGGAALGTIVAPVGGTLAGASAGAALGGTLGGMLGGAVSPAGQKQVGQQGPAYQPLQTPKLSANGQQLQQSLMALKEFDPEFQKQVSFPLVAALMQDVKQNNPGFGGQQPQTQGLGGLTGQPQGLGQLA